MAQQHGLVTAVAQNHEGRKVSAGCKTCINTGKTSAHADHEPSPRGLTSCHNYCWQIALYSTTREHTMMQRSVLYTYMTECCSSRSGQQHTTVLQGGKRTSRVAGMKPAPMPGMPCMPARPPEMTGLSAGSTAITCTTVLVFPNAAHQRAAVGY